MPGRASAHSNEFGASGAAGTARGAEQLRACVERRLAELVAPVDVPPVSLNGAIRHALLAPGKRVRPMLTMLAAAELGAPPEAALDAGCALELVHTASLILDDLPCMDDAATRRGRPATHVAFGEATALLAAIAMLSRAFGVVGHAAGLAPDVRLDLVDILSRASGAEGLSAGQERDLKERAPLDTEAKIDAINDLKTGALFAAAFEMAGRIAGADGRRMSALSQAGHEVGLAFQTLDDLIDLKRSAAEAGKDTGKDGGKGTIALVHGADAACAAVLDHAGRAQNAIRAFAAADGALSGYVAALLDEAAARIAQGS